MDGTNDLYIGAILLKNDKYRLHVPYVLPNGEYSKDLECLASIEQQRDKWKVMLTPIADKFPYYNSGKVEQVTIDTLDEAFSRVIEELPKSVISTVKTKLYRQKKKFLLERQTGESNASPPSS